MKNTTLTELTATFTETAGARSLKRLSSGLQDSSLENAVSFTGGDDQLARRAISDAREQDASHGIVRAVRA